MRAPHLSIFEGDAVGVVQERSVCVCVCERVCACEYVCPDNLS